MAPSSAVAKDCGCLLFVRHDESAKRVLHKCSLCNYFDDKPKETADSSYLSQLMKHEKSHQTTVHSNLQRGVAVSRRTAASAKVAFRQVIGNGGLADGPAGRSPDNDSPLSDGPLGNGPLSDSPVGDIPVGDSALGNGPVGDSLVGDSPVGNGPLGNSPLSDSPVGDSL